MATLKDQLRRIARHHLRGERAGHTLQTSELINEAYLKLIEQIGFVAEPGAFLRHCGSVNAPGRLNTCQFCQYRPASPLLSIGADRAGFLSISGPGAEA